VGKKVFSFQEKKIFDEKKNKEILKVKIH